MRNEKEDDIQMLELSIEHAQEMVDLRDEVLRLSNNDTFKKVIMQGYFENEAVRLVHLMGDPRLKEADREAVQRDMMGIGALKRFLSNMVQMGNAAEKEIADHRETLASIEAENSDEILN